MGASSSISHYIYISSSEDDKHATLLSSQLQGCGHHTIQCDLNQINLTSISSSIESILSKSKCIIVCINEKTLRSFKQIIEINNILDSNKKIIYAMTDKKFTPLTTIHLNGFIQTNQWFMAYDDETLEHTISQLQELL